MFMNKSSRSKRKKKVKANERSERKKKTSKAQQRREERSERARRAKEKKEKEEDRGTTGGTTGAGVTGGNGGALADTPEPSKYEKKKELPPAPTPPTKPTKPIPWSGEETAKTMAANDFFNLETIKTSFMSLGNWKHSPDECSKFKANLDKARAPDWSIKDVNLVKLTHDPEKFICACKVPVPEFNRTMIVTQVPDVTSPPSIEDFWRMIFHEEIVSVVVALMPLECSVTLQQLFPIAVNTFANHGKMFLNNKKVESTVAMTSYTLEILPDGCSNSSTTTVYHLHNWRQKRGLEQVGDLVTTIDKIVKANENTALVSMNGTGRAGTMLTLFTSMLHVNKEKEVKVRDILEKLRAERSGLVENLEQFTTVHRAMGLWFTQKSTDGEIQKKVQESFPAVQ